MSDDTSIEEVGLDIQAHLKAHWGKYLLGSILVLLVIAVAGNAVFNNGDDTATEAPAPEMVDVPVLGPRFLSDNLTLEDFLLLSASGEIASTTNIEDASKNISIAVEKFEIETTEHIIKLYTGVNEAREIADEALAKSATNEIEIASNAIRIDINTASIDELRNRLNAVADKNDRRAGVYKDVLETQGLSPVRVGPFNSRNPGEEPDVLVEVTDAMKPGLDKVIGLVNGGEYKILSIRGYADKTRLSKTVEAMFANNNELAAARAQKVLDYLNDELKEGVLPSVVVRLSAERDRFGGVKENNRRVIIVLQKISK